MTTGPTAGGTTPVIEYIRPTELEIATSAVVGEVADDGADAPSESPIEVLEQLVRPRLADPPCRIAFSGGRDSSALLAVATRVARREGLELPLPVTRIYPGAPRTDEASWQGTVIDHLELREWGRLDFSDEHEFLGSGGRESLRRRGLMWPPALHIHGDWYRQLGPGHLLTGEGGDDVIGNRRIAPLTALLRRRRPRRDLVGHAIRAVAPRAVRRARFRRQLGGAEQGLDLPWLRPEARRHLLDVAVEDIVAEPLRYDAATRAITRRRSWAVYAHNHASLAAEYGIEVFDPFLDPRFVAALARFGGPVGFAGRTATMLALFDGLLPPHLLTRETKALFNDVYMGASATAFARRWDGSGVNTDLVAPDRLRAEWLSEQPSPATALLLQRAWLRSAGYSDSGEGL